MNEPAKPIDSLQDLLKDLDQRLARAVLAAERLYGAQARKDPYRGLYISPEDIVRLFQRTPAEPLFYPEAAETEPDSKPASKGTGRPTGGEKPPARRRLFPWMRQPENGHSAEPKPDPQAPQPKPTQPAADVPADRLEQKFTQLGTFRRLAYEYRLTPFDSQVLLVALAPELDLRYERLYAYLHDDVTRKRPSVDLILNLLCEGAEEKLARRTHFAADAPLVQYGLIRLPGERQDENSPLLSRSIRLDTQLINLLLGQAGRLDESLAAFCTVSRPNPDPFKPFMEEAQWLALSRLVNDRWQAGNWLNLLFFGPDGSGKRLAAEALAHQLDSPLLAADLSLAPLDEGEFQEAMRRLFRQARWTGAVLYLNGIDGLFAPERRPLLLRLLEALEERGRLTIFAGQSGWPNGDAPVDLLAQPFSVLGYEARRRYWENELIRNEIQLESFELDALASRFRMTPRQMDRAIQTAMHHAGLRQAAGEEERYYPYPTLSDLYAAAREGTGRDLMHMAYKIQPRYRWEDIVLPEDACEQLKEIVQRVAYQHVVLGEWGFDEKLSLGKGISALFAGPSGTGKTMAAEIVANRLGLDLYKIDLSGVVSKYIGETEKNLDRIFTAAEQTNGILFFDEADALFGKRSEVRDSHDRYANIEISYLLQKMEEFPGIAILATNLRQNLDDAFVRRLAFSIQFPFPNEAARKRIWEGIWPNETPRGDLDFDFLANQYKVSGGGIKNIALAAAYLAAEHETPVEMAHIFRAVTREYQKLGKTLTEAELYGEYLEARV